MNTYTLLLNSSKDLRNPGLFPFESSSNTLEKIILPPPFVDLDPDFSIKAKEYISHEQQVVVHCQFHHTSLYTPQLRIWPSTFLKCQSSAHVSRLLRAYNIGLYPEWLEIKPFQTHEFTLIFEGLSKECISFDLVEDIPESGGFYGSDILRNPSDVYQIAF